MGAGASNQNPDQPDFPFVVGGQSTEHIAEKIFNQLDRKTRFKCRNVCTSWRDYIDEKTDLWQDSCKRWFVKKVSGGTLCLGFYFRALIEGQTNICHLILRHDRNATDKNPIISSYNIGLTRPLNVAAEQGNVELCHLILSYPRKPKPIKEFDSPLHYAACGGHTNVYKLLTDHYSDPNPCDEAGITPLHLAAFGGHYDLCKLIIESMDNEVNPPSYGSQALSLTFARLNRLLMDQISGIIISGHMTPLHLAAENGHYSVCKLILEKMSADEERSPVNSDGLAPVELARNNKHWGIVRLLLEADPDFQFYPHYLPREAFLPPNIGLDNQKV